MVYSFVFVNVTPRRTRFLPGIVCTKVQFVLFLNNFSFRNPKAYRLKAHLPFQKTTLSNAGNEF